MSELLLSGRICEVSDEVKKEKRFIFLENGRYSEQVSVPADTAYKVGQEFSAKVKNFSGVSTGGRAWQFYATI